MGVWQEAILDENIWRDGGGSGYTNVSPAAYQIRRARGAGE